MTLHAYLRRLSGFFQVATGKDVRTALRSK